MPNEEMEMEVEKEELTSLDGEYEKAVLLSLKYLLMLDATKVTVKEYTAAVEKVNKMYELYRKTVESDRDYIQDYVKDANRKAELELERQKHEDEKKLKEEELQIERQKREDAEAQREAERKAEKKARFWEKVIMAGTGLITGLVGAGVTLLCNKRGWDTTKEMQNRAFKADEDEIRPTSQGHKIVPNGNPFKV